MLEVSGVSKSFGGVVAVNGASSASREAHNRGDRTQRRRQETVFNLASGFMRPDAGSIRSTGRILRASALRRRRVRAWCARFRSRGC